MRQVSILVNLSCSSDRSVTTPPDQHPGDGQPPATQQSVDGKGVPLSMAINRSIVQLPDGYLEQGHNGKALREERRRIRGGR